MKKIIYLLLIPVVMGLFSCSDDDSNPQISFSSSTYILPAEDAIEVTVKCSEPVISALSVGFAVSGTAVLDEDYLISANEFVFNAGESTAKITVTPKANYDENKTIILSIKNVAGYDFGSNITTTIGVQAKEKLIYSFKTNKYDMPDTLEVSMDVKGMVTSFVNMEDMHIPFIISDKSTAVQGEHFEVVGGVNEFVIPKGEKKATIKLAFKNKEEGKDKLVLAFGEMSKRFVPGNYIETNINLFGHLSESNLVGKWVFKSFSNYSDYKDMWCLSDDKLAELPVSVATDTLEFVAENDKFTFKPILEGDLKNYFKECDFAYSREVTAHLGMSKITLSMMEMTEGNYSFSATTENIKKVQVGFRIIEGGEILEVSINDYYPVDFLVTEAGYMSATDDPRMVNMPLMFHFSKVK